MLTIHNTIRTDRAEKLRSFRRRIGLKQMALADMLGVDQATVSRWESGSSPIHDRIWTKLLKLKKAQNAGKVLPARHTDIDLDKYWPELLRHYRELRKVSQEQLSETLGNSAHSISRWELRLCKPSLASQIKLIDIILSCVETDALLRNLIMQDSEAPRTLPPQQIPVEPRTAATRATGHYDTHRAKR